VQAAAGPHYVGESIEIQVTASGFDEDPTPEARVRPPARGRLELLGVSPSVNRQITIVGGRLAQTSDVRFVYDFRFVSDQSGQVVVGPFHVVQGSQERVAPELRLDILPVPTSGDLRVALKLPTEPIYVGERVPVRLEFWLESRLRKNLESYTLRVPLFDLTDAFRFLDDEGAEGNTDVVIAMATGRLELRGAAREVRQGKKRFLVVSVERTLVPLQASTQAIPAAGLTVSEGKGWRRDLFGGRRATHVRKWRAVDAAHQLEVRPVPVEDRPQSFAGAVGKGFTLEAAADRTVVQVGDPITLTLTLRGEGLETAALPPLDAEGLLPAGSFRAGDGELAGVILGDAKRFTAVVRVLNERVAEIPELAYSWFDPSTESFQTTRSRPIALSVRSAEVIGAADVLAERGEEAATGRADRTDEAERPGGPAPAARSFALTGADLAIERDASALLRDARSAWGGAWLPAGLYGSSALLLLLAILDRRRRDVDPVLLRRRRLLAEEQRRIHEATRRPAGEAVGEIAGALRRMLAEVPDAAGSELSGFLGECDARSYAPDGHESPDLGEAFHERAALLARGIAERVG
jgi:hypothetical protein